MRSKKGLGWSTVVILWIILIFLVVYLTWGINLFPPLIKAFNFLINMISVSYGKTPDIEAGTLTPPEELNKAYNAFVSSFNAAKYSNECLIYNIQFPQDFQSYSIVLERSSQKDYNGLFVLIYGPKGEEVKRDFIEQKYPCVVTGQSQVQYFIDKFVNFKSPDTQQKYARANKISIKGKNSIIVNYESGAPLTNGVLDNSNLMFNVDQNNICLLPVYSSLINNLLGISGYDRGIPTEVVRNLALRQKYIC